MVSYFAASEFNSEFGKFNLIRLSDLVPQSYDKGTVEQLYRTQVENLSFSEDSFGKYKDDSCEYMSNFYKSEGLKTNDYLLKFYEDEVVLRFRGSKDGFRFKLTNIMPERGASDSEPSFVQENGYFGVETNSEDMCIFAGVPLSEDFNGEKHLHLLFIYKDGDYLYLNFLVEIEDSKIRLNVVIDLEGEGIYKVVSNHRMHIFDEYIEIAEL